MDRYKYAELDALYYQGQPVTVTNRRQYPDGTREYSVSTGHWYAGVEDGKPGAPVTDDATGQRALGWIGEASLSRKAPGL